jgi:hypothetical protein
VSGYERFAEGIRKNDPEEIKAAIKTLKDIEKDQGADAAAVGNVESTSVVRRRRG